MKPRTKNQKLEGISKPRIGRSGRGNESPYVDNAEGLVASSTTKNRECVVLKRNLQIAISVVAILLAVTLPALSLAQQIDSNGWSEFKPVVQANQPASIQSSFPNQFVPPTVAPIQPPADLATAPQAGFSHLTAEVRNQIGLASFEQLVVTAEPDGTDVPDFQTGYPNQPTQTAGAASLSELFSSQSEQLTSRDGLGSSIKVALLLATLSLAPAIVLMTTCYIRVVVVLSLLKQAFGAQQLPPTQVLTALSLFVTLLVMTPVWNQVKTEAIDPYQAENGISWDEAWERGVVPVKSFMAKQIESAGNGESIALFYKYLPDHQTLAPPTNAQEVPLNVLLPAFMVSELKVAFLLGFQIFLPFLVLDLVVSSVTVSTGMLMLPPTMVSFPLKLMLFVLVDGWNLVIGMLLQSFI